MKISLIINGAPGGEGSGATHSATQLIRGLCDQSHNVTIYCTDSPEHENLQRATYKYLNTESRLLTNDKRLNKSVVEHGAEIASADVIHSYNQELLSATAEIAGSYSTTTIQTLQAYGGICPKNDLRFLNRTKCSGNGYLKCATCAVMTTPPEERRYNRLLRGFKRGVGKTIDLNTVRSGKKHSGEIACFHTYTNHVANTYTEHGFPNDRIEIINPILDPRFILDHNSNFHDPYNLLYAGRLSPEKGVTKLISVLELLMDEYDRNVSLTIAGDGELRQTLEVRAARRNLDEAINFLGHVPYRKMPETYASHDLMIYPGNWQEPFGRIFIEALACGTPVVSTDIGSASEILGDAGRVTDLRVSSLAAGVNEILAPDKLKKMSAKSQQLITDYHARHVIPKMESMYNTALSENE